MHGGQPYFLASLTILPRLFYTRSRPFARIWSVTRVRKKYDCCAVYTGTEVTAKSVQECSRGKEENAVAPLCTTLKDHNNSFLQRKVDVSFRRYWKSLFHQFPAANVSSPCKLVVPFFHRNCKTEQSRHLLELVWYLTSLE